jgi:Flp pilus assembly protein TadG
MRPNKVAAGPQAPASRQGFRLEERGQAIVMIALLITSLMGFIGLVVDVAWFQLNLVRVQRAADAGALAGSVYLPGNIPGAQTAARGATSQNGYTNGVGGVTVSAAPDAINAQMLNVAVTTTVNTWFMRIFGVNSITASRNARAEFILPVPMGSPLAYYGVHELCRDGDTPPATPPGTCIAVPSAAGGGATLPTEGFWGAVETHGAQRGNGDAYSTGFDGGSTPNPGYDPLGYSYIVEFPAGTTNGRVYVFDPVFCATGAGTSGGVNGRRLGVGDAYLVQPSSSAERQVTTEYKLWDEMGTPYSTGDDLLLGGDDGVQFTNVDLVDKGAGSQYRGNQRYDLGNNYNGSSSADCSASVYHNAWWQIPTPGYPGGLPAGSYRLQVKTSSGSTNQNAVNNFSLQATGNVAGMRLYGQSRMCVFNAISGTSIFYLAQIAAVHAGKTLEIKLFDPGDIRDTLLYIQQPGAAGYTDATFSYSATGCAGSGCTTSGTNVTSLRTSTAGGTNYYNNQWVTITVTLPTSYTAPTPPGEPGPGWWKIKYATAGSGQDVTTWSVNIRGNPVHLVTP